jgi:hypothetical protein
MQEIDRQHDIQFALACIPSSYARRPMTASLARPVRLGYLQSSFASPVMQPLTSRKRDERRDSILQDSGRSALCRYVGLHQQTDRQTDTHIFGKQASKLNDGTTENNHGLPIHFTHTGLRQTARVAGIEMWKSNKMSQIFFHQATLYTGTQASSAA